MNSFIIYSGVFFMFIIKKPADKEKLKKNSRKLYQANSGAGN